MGQATLFLTITAMVVQLSSSTPAPWPVSSPVLAAHGPLTQSSTAAVAAQSATTASPLDFETFRTKVQPILTSPRKGNARCTACHSRGGGNAYLEPLTPGSTTYSEEQSRRNFERVQRLVVPGEPLKSVLLTNPLATVAGGSHWHGGGKHWQAQDNPEWQTLAGWVRGN